MKIIIIFGPPGVGKGTQASLMAKKLDLEHVSTGNILREEVAKKSKLGIEVEGIINKGHLVPDELIINIIEDYISKKFNCNGLLFDGFPRTLNQSKMFELILEKKNLNDIKVINLIANEKELIKRLLNRGNIEKRADDNEKTIKNRLLVYEKQTLLILEYFKSLNRKVIDIDGFGEVEEINQRIISALK